MVVQVASIVIAGGGAFALMKGPFPMSNFFVAGTLVYMGTIVLEGGSMSLTSKVRLKLALVGLAPERRCMCTSLS